MFTHHPRYVVSYLEAELGPCTVEDLIPGLQGYFETLIREQLEDSGSKDTDAVPISVAAQLVVSAAIQQHRYTQQVTANEWREGRHILCEKIQGLISATLNPPPLIPGELPF
jgi:hypothetical protein